MAQGHPDARHYPVPMLWTEMRIVRTRVNKEMADQAALTQMVIASVLSKKGAEALKKQLRALTEA